MADQIETTQGSWDLSDASTETEVDMETVSPTATEEKFKWQTWKDPPVYIPNPDDFIDAMGPITGVSPSYKREEDGIRFTPSACVQRYNAVLDMIRRHQKYAKKVVDFGCCDCRFIEFVKKKLPTVKHLIGVDLDGLSLQQNIYRIRPLTAEFLWRREFSLKISSFQGSVFDFDSRIADVDVVTCIELLEHLHLDTLDAFVDAIFGRLKPFLVIITTPNEDFNVLFDMKDRKFRHPDHKFEWTRKQFEDWGDNITRKYNSYWVKYFGIAAGPPGSEQFGMCSQMAVFRRPKEGYRADRDERKERAELNPVLKYQLVADVDYPTAYTFLSWAARVQHEVSYSCYQYSNHMLAMATEEGSQDELLDEFGCIRVPIDLIMQYPKLKELCEDKGKLVDALLEYSTSGPFWQFDTTPGSEAIYYPVASSKQDSDDSEREEENHDDIEDPSIDTTTQLEEEENWD